MDKKNEQSVQTLFRHVLLRSANGDLAAFPQGEEQLTQIVREIDAKDQAMALLRTTICDDLFALIPAYREDDRFQSFIQLKRDIFNARKLSITQRALLKALPARLNAAVENLDKIERDRSAFYENYLAAYRRTVQHFEVSLQGLARNKDFRKALLLSSEVLLSKTQGYASNYIACGNGQQKRLFFSLLRYLSRMFFKPSPFSLFTTIGLLPLAKAPCISPFSLKRIGKARSHVRINSAILAYIRHLLVAHPATRKNLPLRYNATAQINDGYIQFLELTEQTETVKRIKYTELLEAVSGYLQKRQTFSSLRDSLMPAVAAGKGEQLNKLLEELLANGLLQIDWEVASFTDDWPAKLKVWMSGLPVPTDISDAIGAFLVCLMEAEEQYGEAVVKRRQSFHQACAAAWQQMLVSFGEVALPYRGRQPTFLYEDATAKVSGEIEENAVQKFAGLVEELATFLQSIDSLEPERERIKAHFAKLRGSQKGFEMDLLGFYRSYRQAFPQDEKGNNGPDDAFDKAYQLRYRKMLDKIKELDSFKAWHVGQETLHIDKLIEENEGLRQVSVRSRAAFLQPFVDKERNELCAVVNAVFQGMGKGQGRFLHLLPPEVISDLRVLNKISLGDITGMDLCDASLFNANRHPPLLDHVLGWEGGQHAYDKGKEIDIKDLLLCWDNAPAAIKLIHRQNRKQLCPFDLSLQALNRRAGLYRFMVYFSSEQALSFRPFALALDEILDVFYRDTTMPVRLLPRMVYRNRLVIRRRAWLVAVDALPKRMQGEVDEAVFLRFRHFFDRWKMPQRVFMKLKPRTQGVPVGDEYKPQYLDTYLPPFILLLERLLPKADKHIYFEEFLPDPTRAETKRVTECLIQWYN